MRICGYLVLFMLLPGPAPGASIYRCEGDSGEPEFSQQPCGESVTRIAGPGQRGDRPGGGLRASERAWLAARERALGPPAAKTDARRRDSQSAEAAARRAYQCRRKRRQLDELNADMRRGYKPASGERLRRRRAAYQDYLASFCS